MAAYDPEAAVAFWDDGGRLPHAALAEVDCPVRAWWGERDAVLSSLLSSDELGRDLASRGVEYNVVPGSDHTGMLDRLDLILPTIASWLVDQSSRERRSTGDDHRGLPVNAIRISAAAGRVTSPRADVGGSSDRVAG